MGALRTVSGSTTSRTPAIMAMGIMAVAPSLRKRSRSSQPSMPCMVVSRRATSKGPPVAARSRASAPEEAQVSSMSVAVRSVSTIWWIR